ncbi:MAG TPA: hypothetical protein VG757_15990 [Devosia sp.]|nr:hypothetical protein [Devosia sp.]
MRNLPALINGTLMVAMLVAGGGMSAYVALTPELRGTFARPLPGYDYLNGHITSTIEQSYKDELPIREQSVDLLNAFTLALFTEGRKGVVVGEDGWLFSAEEYDWTPKSPANLERNLGTIEAIAAELKARGITLEIALLPEKADIYSSLLLKPRPLAHQGKYDAVRARIAALTGTIVPNLRGALMAKAGAEDVFVPTDTHWSVAGAGIAADMIAEAFSPGAIAPAAFALKSGTPETHSGDLLHFLELGPFEGLLPDTEESVTPVIAVAMAGDADAFLADAAAPEVALVGTSYSANPLWSFEAQLKAALGRDILNLSEQGHGPMEPMSAFLARLRTGEIAVKAVIWEMPLRYLDDDPKAAATGSPI